MKTAWQSKDNSVAGALNKRKLQRTVFPVAAFPVVNVAFACIQIFMQMVLPSFRCLSMQPHTTIEENNQEVISEG